MIYADKTELIQCKNQRITHIWVVCDCCGFGRWSQPKNAEVLPNGQPCRPCSNRLAWDGKRIDLSKGIRKCATCGKNKTLSEFSMDKRKRLGVRSSCRECMAIKKREYHKRHPERVNSSRRISQAKRRAAKRGSSGEFTIADWNKVLRNYGNKCLACGTTEDLQPDHVIPLSKGGIHDVSNIQPLCGLCNRRKQANYIDYRNGQN